MSLQTKQAWVSTTARTGGKMNALKEIIAVLGGTAVVLGFAAWLAKTLIKSLLEHDTKTRVELLKDKKQRERDQIGRDADANKAREERLRNEVLRWANPILGAVSDLRARLSNILRRQAYPALSRNPATAVDTNWSITYDYFMPSTLFLFAQYFYWVRRLQVEISFELFETQADKDLFMNRLRNVGDALGKWPLHDECDGTDRQVFALQQRGIGEAMMVRADGGRCVGFDEFMDSWEDTPLVSHLSPLRALLEDVMPGATCRWRRLESIDKALEDLETHCRDILAPRPQEPTLKAT